MNFKRIAQESKKGGKGQSERETKWGRKGMSGKGTKSGANVRSGENANGAHRNAALLRGRRRAFLKKTA